MTQVGAATSLRCYDFDVRNDNPSLGLTGVQFDFGAPGPVHMTAPAGWGWRVSPGGSLGFATPPPPPPPPPIVALTGGKPIGPRKTLGGFRFCLGSDQTGARIDVNFEKGPGAVAGVFGGATVGGIVFRNTTLHCASFNLTTPADADVHDIQLRRPSKAADPGFDEIAFPYGTVERTRDGVALIGGIGVTMRRGTNKTIAVCVRTQPATFDWYFTDKNHRPIPGSKGTVTLK